MQKIRRSTYLRLMRGQGSGGGGSAPLGLAEELRLAMRQAYNDSFGGVLSDAVIDMHEATESAKYPGLYTDDATAWEFVEAALEAATGLYGSIKSSATVFEQIYPTTVELRSSGEVLQYDPATDAPAGWPSLTVWSPASLGAISAKFEIYRTMLGQLRTADYGDWAPPAAETLNTGRPGGLSVKF